MMQPIRLSTRNPGTTDQEVRAIVTSMYRDFDFRDYEAVLGSTVRLFEGKMAGFAGCDTGYHDLSHTLSSLLATARLLHGVHISRQPISERIIHLCLIAALFHDTGYIRRLGENKGTGAQFTRTHVQRSVDLLKADGACRQWPQDDIQAMASMIRCTDPASAPEAIYFESEEDRLGGHILATADLLAQMADDTYLEKLPMLYAEFAEAGIAEFESEYDLFSQTMDFCQHMRRKMQGRLSNVMACMGDHFRQRHGVARDLYSEAVDRNMNYLTLILQDYGEDYRRGLRRNLDRKPMPVLVAA
ncbi:metal-dependent phosphohydrolase [Pseudodesulfovibrio cashew]|uniref:Metal-dependent phosphohydrolase n=1 Tax=Pseudodesulfovibrio cashew TaxID=2678688 RepID=A0A6I6JM31_9BACT|nr:HD domain-containing protein [Pseudodesulfovibrio cashew]QGY38744.1 metal-dependent phosphohydrolase [Pseudodesulfovibrio cashew]